MGLGLTVSWGRDRVCAFLTSPTVAVEESSRVRRSAALSELTMFLVEGAEPALDLVSAAGAGVSLLTFEALTCDHFLRDVSSAVLEALRGVLAFDPRLASSAPRFVYFSIGLSYKTQILMSQTCTCIGLGTGTAGSDALDGIVALPAKRRRQRC